MGSIIISPKGKIISRGRKRFMDGTKNMVVHAERDAINNSPINVSGLYLITTLEPCLKINDRQILCSCSEFIVDSGLSAVVYGLSDNSPSMYEKSASNYLSERGLRIIRYFDLSEKIEKHLMPSQQSYKLA